MPRRSQVHCLALLASLCAAGGPAPAAEPAADLATRAGEDWGAFLGPSGNGRAAAAGMRAPWPRGGPRLVWHCELGDGYCAPAVARGRAVVLDRIGEDVRIRCLHAETGAKLWEERFPTAYSDTFGYDGGPRAAPVIDGDRVLVYGPEGTLECRDVTDGARLWRVETAARYHVVQNFFGVGAAPLVVAGGGKRLVIAQVGGSPPGTAPPAPERLDLVKGLDSGLVAFDLATGGEVWRSSDQLASYSAPVLAEIAGRPRVLAWMRDDLLVVDPADGAVSGRFRWRDADVFSAVAASPVVRGSEVLLTEAYGPGSVLLDVTVDGLRERRRDAPGARPDRALKAHWSTPVLHDGHLYGQSGRHSGDSVLLCVEWASGAVRWSEGGFGRASVTLVGDHLVVLGEYGDLALVRATPERYVEESRARILDAAGDDLLAPPCWAAPVVARGLLYVRGKGRLVCLDVSGD